MFAKTQIIGRLGQDCDVRYMPSGAGVANFSVATDEKWKDKQTGEKKERTTWYRCALFGPVVEAISQYLTKGQLVFCEGIMHERKWTDKNDVERYSWEMKVNEVKLLGGDSRGSSGGSRGSVPGAGAPPAGNTGRGGIPDAPGKGGDDFDDDIPF